MNCLDFRRLKLAAPKQMPPEADEHVATCAACAEFARHADRFELKLEAAVKVPVEPTLADRVLLDHQLKRGSRMRLYAVAASLVAAIALSVGLVYQTAAPDPTLAQASIRHVIGEPAALVAEQRVTPQQLAEALAVAGASMKSGSLEVSYLHDCPVPGGMGKHIVVKTPAGKATLILMPNRSVSRRVVLAQHGLSTAVLPAKKGSYAIVTTSAQELAAAEQAIEQRVSWRS